MTVSVNAAPAWGGAPLALTEDLDDDAALLAAFAAGGERQLAALPPRPARTPAQQESAEAILARLRTARGAFLNLHVDAVYARLTEDLTRRVRLGDLVYAAADRFPGLVPGRARMETELAFVQADKEGLEIDQAAFCAALLRSGTAGPHLIDTMLTPTPRALSLLDEFRATGRIDLGSVLVERRNGAGHVTFRNAHCLNAEDNRLIADLEAAVDLVLMDEDVRVGVLRGGSVDHPRYAGRRVFSAGINLKDLRNGAISFVDFLLGRELGYIHKMLRGLLTAPDAPAWCERTVQKPWIGAVDSFAIGGGMQLLLVLDRVILASDAYVSLPAAEEGIVPGLGNLRVSRHTGARLARQVLLGGRRITAAEPEARLVCDEVVPADEVTAAVDRAVQELSAPAVVANRRMLALVEEPLDLYRTYLAEFALVQVARSYSDDVLSKVERRWQDSLARG
ncbi:(3,5-dihydroxyphenyl)acetyl-CoA 1,2-dioxygenase DpgC [Streptomyces sp. SAI-229]|jgi:thioesterase DpgC|uniref:(3,5-dihydroxyphenyl)acetyl-CoA 1,2-dioxygenase DpgC n=1 Tax=Streptomyces sp. SAI-229 TaxID=3377731 RepID=UPI003C7DF2CF